MNSRPDLAVAVLHLVTGVAVGRPQSSTAVPGRFRLEAAGFRVEADWLGPVPTLSPGMQGVGKITVGRANLLTIWTRSSIDWLRMKWWTWW